MFAFRLVSEPSLSLSRGRSCLSWLWAAPLRVSVDEIIRSGAPPSINLGWAFRHKVIVDLDVCLKVYCKGKDA